jgi:hypothetical protein
MTFSMSFLSCRLAHITATKYDYVMLYLFYLFYVIFILSSRPYNCHQVRLCDVTFILPLICFFLSCRLAHITATKYDYVMLCLFYLFYVLFILSSRPYNCHKVKHRNNNHGCVESRILQEVSIAEYKVPVNCVGCYYPPTSKCCQMSTKTLYIAGIGAWSNLYITKAF